MPRKFSPTRRGLIAGVAGIGAAGCVGWPMPSAFAATEKAAGDAATMTPTSGVTARLASFVQETEFGSLSKAVVHTTKRVICDTLACAIGGYQLEAGKIMTKVAKAMGGPAEASLLGSGARGSAAAAAFANGYLGNVLDADDTLLNSGHPAVCSVFPALALAESRGLSGKALITAVALGYDVGSRIGLASVWSQVDKQGNNNQSRRRGLSWYSFCATVAAGKVLQLDQPKLINAMGLVGFTAPIGFALRWQSREAGKNMMKYSPTGFINFNGTVSAQLAEKGFTADEAILDGNFAYGEMSGAFGIDGSVLLADLGRKWWITETSLKPYAVGRFAHHSIDVFRKLQHDHAIRPDDIVGVEILTFETAARDWFNVRTPKTQIDVQFSIPMAIAAVAHGSHLGPEWQSPEMVQNQELRSFAQKVGVAAHPDAARVIRAQIETERRFRKVPTRVSITTRDGQTFSAETVSAWGDPWDGARPMTDDEIKTKFRNYADGLLTPRSIENLTAILFDLENVSDVGAALRPVLRPA